MASTPPPPPSYRDPRFLTGQAASILKWYSKATNLAPEGGLYHAYRDDGSVYDTVTRHLVSSTRFVVTFSWGVRALQSDAPLWRQRLDTCLTFLRTAHTNPVVPGAYAWLVAADGASTHPINDANKCYGLAFVLLAYATALSAGGVADARAWVDDVWDTLTHRFWEEQHGLYADEADATYSTRLPYRGQNANMHAVEAHLAAWDATGDARHLRRARTIAHSMCVVQAGRAGSGLVYEHFTEDWSAPDLQHNVHNKKDNYQPWGYQPGHLMEWSKLLMQLHDRRDAIPGHPEEEKDVAWRPLTAARFFEVATSKGWDAKYGGLAYCLSPADLSVCDNDKYWWPVTEGIAAASLLALAAHRSGDAAVKAAYLDWYGRLWAYGWAHLIDHGHDDGGGAWFRVINEDGSPIDDLKSPPGKVGETGCSGGVLVSIFLLADTPLTHLFHPCHPLAD